LKGNVLDSADEAAVVEKKPTSQDFALEILRSELSRRMLKNPSYSLRALAKTLGVSHTLLSLVMNGKRKPSRAILEKMVENLNLSATQSSRLLKGTPSRKRWQVLPGAQTMTLDQFAFISEWQHYAILSLLEIPDTEFTPHFISQRLGISLTQANVSMQRLVQMGIVVQDPDGKWRQKDGPIVFENTKPTETYRKFNRQLLEKAIESLENDPFETRDFSSVTFAMSPSQIPHAIQRIREFRRQLMCDLEAEGKPEEVYHLTVQLFPSSKRRKS
jgi:transcriptional regulator with XRE-family HTH domain